MFLIMIFASRLRRSLPGSVACITAAMSLVLMSMAAPASVVIKPAIHWRTGQTALAMRNGALDQLDTGGLLYWQPVERGYEVDRQEPLTGDYAARCENRAQGERRGLRYVAELNQSLPAAIYAEAWSKALGVTGEADADYSLYLDIEYMDGTPLWGQVSPFDVGSHRWQRGTVTVVPEKPIRRVSVYGLFRNHLGTVWFDDFSLWQTTVPRGTSVFDHVPVIREPATRRNSQMAPITMKSADCMTLNLPEPSGGLLLRDVAAKSDFLAPTGTLTPQSDGSVRLEAAADELRLALSATYRVADNAVRVEGEVRDLSARDRAITVYFTLPVEAAGWQWHDDQRHARAIKDTGKYEHMVGTTAGENGLASRYPLACISSAQEAVALAVPLDEPRICRLGYDADSKELYVAFDLGLAPDTELFPAQASFSFVLYRPDPAWGFRAALARYYELFPHCFTKRNEKEGSWMPFTDIATVEGFEDFGFQFKEGDNNVAFDAAHGIHSFVYVEPWSNWVNMPKDLPRTVEAAAELVRQRAAEGREQDQATLSSVLENDAGAWAVRIEKQPWCDGAVVGLNPAPGVPTGSPGGTTQYANLMRQIDEAYARSPQLTGVYHDSFEMYLFPQYLNYRREHFRQARFPLTFDRTGRVCQYAMFTMVEFAQEVARKVWARGGMTFANGTPHGFPWGTPWLDVMGTETAWSSSWTTYGDYQPPSDADFNYWRALCYQRPYLLLLNTRYDQWQPEWFELYLKRCAAYGVFPSMFSHNASEDPYWQNPALYNSHRPLFRRYLPAIKELSAAGWQPVTYARNNNPKVYVERFGTSPGTVHFTLFNDSQETQHATVTIDLTALGLAGGQVAAHNLLARLEAKPLVLDGKGNGLLEVHLEPEDVRIVALNR